jgi:hypoxanthine phosphoribosyltransferase
VTAAAGLPAAPVTLLDEDDLARCVARLGDAIGADHPDGVVLVVVLKGALCFAADLVRAMTAVDVTVTFVAVSRYSPGSDRARVLLDLDVDVAGRDVVIVEDIVDTGLTLGFLVEHVQARGARRVDACALLDRPAGRIVPLPVRYVGMEIPDVYVLGYGLHQGDLYRNVPRVVVVDPTRLRVRPDAYLDALYGTSRPAGEPPGGRC